MLCTDPPVLTHMLRMFGEPGMLKEYLTVKWAFKWTSLFCVHRFLYAHDVPVTAEFGFDRFHMIYMYTVEQPERNTP